MNSGRIQRDIIDNETDGVTMQRVLCSEIPHVDRFDVSTGYFDVAGYGRLRKDLEVAVQRDQFLMRLLLGKGSIRPPSVSFERHAEMHAGPPDPELDEPPSVKAALDKAGLEKGPLDDTTSLIALLERSNVHVRLGPSRFNHSKCYILGGNSAFIGSSNLTAGGMVGNYELNAGLYQPKALEETHRWFDHMWEEATDAKDDLLRILKQSKFGVPPPPYDVYMKMLFEKYRNILRRDDRPRREGARLAAFQQDAVDTAAHIMGDHGGAIIADSTGLGKTIMGIEIIRQKMLDEGRKVMLVAPAQVLKSVWEEKLKEAGIMARETVTMEKMGQGGFADDARRYRNIDLVVIDESQNFRSKNAQRRQNLMKVLSVGVPKQVLLLTATPINNSLMDLYYQLSIITNENDDHFWEATGIADLHKHMHDATKKDLDGGLGKIQQLLDAVMVRRTRSFIRAVYENDKINGREITFPDHEYKPIKYDMAGLYGDIFGRLYDDILSLTMAPYSPERYNTGLTQDKRDQHMARAHLQVVLLLKRFESSIEAVKISIRNKIRMYEHVERALRNGRMLRVREFNAALAKWGNREIDGEDADGGEDVDPEEAFVRLVGGIAEEKAGGAYDIKAMLADTASDLETLRALGAAVGRVTVDKKFEAARDMIIKDGALDGEGRKVLVFTEYAATAKHLHKKLSREFTGKSVQIIHGGTGADSRQDVIRRFAPLANLPGGDSLAEGEKEIDILVSTEVLSEGQNLQDCNYVVNYDLPWNPMRIVQRTGRVDRLTSRHGTVHTRACYPDSELDGLLKLVGKLMEKIDVADKAVGTDVEILGKMPNPKEFNGRMAMDVKALVGQGSDADSVIRRLEAESDMLPQSTPFNEIVRHVKDIGFDAMGEVPMGRRSGRRGEGQKAVLAYLQEGGGGRTRRVHFVVYDYATDGAVAAGNDADALRLASCAMDAPTHLPMDGADHRESFDDLIWIDRKARQAIADRGRAGAKMVADMQRKRKTGDRDIQKLQRILIDAVRDDSGRRRSAPPGRAGAAGDDRVPEEDANRAYKLLGSNRFRPWRDTARRMLAAYEADGDARRLANEVLRFEKIVCAGDGEAGGSGNEGGDGAHAGAEGGTAADLVLIGAQFVMDEYDPYMGRKGLDRHTG